MANRASRNTLRRRLALRFAGLWAAGATPKRRAVILRWARAARAARRRAVDARPLGLLGMLALPYLVASAPADQKEVIRQRARMTRERAERRKRDKEARRAITLEAKNYGTLIIQKYAQMGNFDRPRNPGERPEKVKPRKLYRVRFDDFRISEGFDRIYFRIATTHRGLFGWQSALPYNVYVRDLISENALFELSHHIKRFVSAEYRDPTRGAWIIVDRLVSMAGFPKKVDFQEVLSTLPDGSYTDLWVALGVGVHRTIKKENLFDHPHMLVAGSAGGGKSNMVNNIICTLIRNVPIEDLRMVLIDFKKVEFSHYEGMPHLLTVKNKEDKLITDGIVTEFGELLPVLNFLKDEVERRNELMKKRAKNIGDFNKRFPDEKIPHIFCFIDEYAAIKLIAPKPIADAAEDLITFIANIARSSGIHIVISTQRPAVQVVSNAIKINCTMVIAGPTQNSAQSAVIIDQGSAALLPREPRGRMLVLLNGALTELQTPFISDEKVYESIRVAKGRAAGVLGIRAGNPVLNYEGALAFVREAGGGVSESRRVMRDLGVSGPLWSEFLRRLKDTGASVKRGNKRYLVPELITNCLVCGKPSESGVCPDCLKKVSHPAVFKQADSAFSEVRGWVRPGDVGDKLIAADPAARAAVCGPLLGWVLGSSGWSVDRLIPVNDDAAGLTGFIGGGLPVGGALRWLADVPALPDRVEGQAVVLVGFALDDAMRSAADALRASGAINVLGLVLVLDMPDQAVVNNARKVLKKGKVA